jgi:tetratricopeptide (TPR) repeat protein
VAVKAYDQGIASWPAARSDIELRISRLTTLVAAGQFAEVDEVCELEESPFNKGDIDIYREHLCFPHTCSRQYLVERARLLNALRRHDEAADVCRRALSPSTCGTPSDSWDLYYLGFCYFLCTLYEAALAFYDQSAQCGDHYSELMSARELCVRTVVKEKRV